MKKALLAASIALIATGANAQVTPYDASKAATSYAEKIEAQNKETKYENKFTVSVSNSNLESSFAIDSSRFSLVDTGSGVIPAYGSPTSKLEYEANAAKYLNLGFERLRDNHSFEVTAEIALDYADGLNRDYDWYSKSYAQWMYGSTETMFSGTESNLTEFGGIGLTFAHNYKLVDGGFLDVFVVNSLNIDHNFYEVSGAILTDEPSYDTYPGYSVGDVLLTESEQALKYTETYATYSIGLKTNFNLTKNLYTSLDVSLVPFGAYFGEDIHHQRWDLSQTPSVRLNSYSVTGYKAEFEVGYDFPIRSKSTSVGLYAKAYHHSLSANGIDEMVTFEWNDGQKSRVDLNGADRVRTGLEAGFKYRF